MPPPDDPSVAELQVRIAALEAQLASSTAPSEDELRDRLVTYIQSAPLCLWAIDPDGVVTLSEGRGLATLGLTPGGLVGQNVFDVYADFPAALEPIRVALSGEEGTSTVEIGDLVFENRYFPRLSEGRVAGVIGISMDVTARAAAERALRASELRWRSLMENTPDNVSLIDREHRIVYLNHTQLLKLEQVIGTRIHDYVAPSHLQTVLDAIDAVFAGAESQTLESHVVLEGGVSRWYQNRLFPMLEDGEVKLVTMVSSDITEAKREADERIRLNDRLQHRQKLESLGILAGGIAHDFNNLLVGILGNADLALAESTDPARSERGVKEILRAAERARELCRQLLAYSGQGQFEVTHVDLSALVREMYELVVLSADKATPTELELAPELPPIRGDAAQIQQVVMNLLTNATEATTGRPGAVRLTTGQQEASAEDLASSELRDDPPPGQYVYVEVQDQGCGMDEATHAAMFDPFFSTKTTGRGLGMASVLGIMRGHRGALLVQTRLGEGTTIRALFPAAAPSAEEAPPKPASSPTGTRHTGTVLVADDERLVRRVATVALQQLGLTVVEAADGQQAVERYREHADSIVLLVLDLSMPGLGGREVLATIRQHAPDLPAIFSSGFSEQSLEPGEKAHFLPKPYRIRDLHDLVEQLLGE
jgi:PAS domain S-box-containing protein